jgi:aryl-alcohol dehydrogenase-like predicted oxidoreductase
MGILKRRLGRTGIDVTILGLGGEGVLRTNGYEREAYGLINRAIDLGLRYFESARAYSGSETYYGRALRERRKDIFLTSKSHARTTQGALLHLEETLKNRNTDHLDLWQMHDVRTRGDMEEIFGPGGAAGAFVRAKEKGLARFIGVTGHQDPLIIRECIERFDFDTVLIPVNPAEPVYRDFIEGVIPAAAKKGMGIIGMKVYLRGLFSRLPGFKSMEPFFRFALSNPVSCVVIGCDDTDQLEENVRFAAGFEPMSDGEKKELIDRVSPYARELMYYKV